jgi:putative transposase
VSQRPLQWELPIERLLAPRHGSGRWPGFVRITRPDQLWTLDTTRVRVGGWWANLHVALDCCTREVVGWNLEVLSRPTEAITCLELAIARRHTDAGRLTVHAPRRPPFATRPFRRHLRARGIALPRWYRNDLAPRALADHWIDHFHTRCSLRADWHDLADARHDVAAYVDAYQHRQQAGLAHCTPAEVAALWRGGPA